jgi:NAD(P)-dependent dehydrogenase (short-subunit alcohol dehydrogenase family)
VTAVSALAGGGADQGDTAAVAPAVQEAPEPDELPIAAPARQIGRVLPELVDAPIGPGQDLAGRRVLVTDPGGAVAEHVVALLQQAGAHAVRLCAADLADDAATAVQRARPVDAVVHLLALGTPSGATWDDRIALETRTLVSVLQAAAEDLCRDGRGRVLAATALGRREDGDLAGTSQAAITGLLRSLAHEWPDTAICAVHLDLTQDAAVLAAQIRDELCAAEPEREITYTGGRRRATRLRPAALDGGPPRLSLDEKAVVLVTGGARGITALAARAIARRWRPRLVLVGRTPWPEPEDPALAHVDDERELKRALMERLGTASLAEVDAAYRRLRDQREMRTTVRDIEAAGARVQYREVDVRDPVAVAALIAEFDRLDVVVHGAGVIEDRRFVQKSWDSFERVLATKAGGALNLSRQLDARSLQAFVLFASTAGRLGNAGQCDYAAANAVLDELAARLDADWPGRVVAIDWGPWKVGMTTPEVLRRFAAQRVEAIEPDQGVRALLEELEHGRKGEPEVVLGNGPWSRQLPLVTGDGAIRRNGRVELMRVLDTASDRFLRDHCLDGRPVLPAAVALEALAELAQHERPSRQVWAVEGLQVLRGVVLDAPTARLTIAAEGLEVGPDHRGEERLTLSIGGPGEVTQHYRATALIADRLPQAPAHVPAEGLQPFPASVEEAYSRWLFQGSSLQGISALHGISDTCVAATLRASTPEQLVAASAGRWLFDPVVIDSAFQLVILWARLHVDMTPLPAEIAAVRRFAAELPAEVRCELRVAPSGGGHVLDTDFTFTDDRGRVVLQVAGMRFICRRELNRVATAAGREPAP